MDNATRSASRVRILVGLLLVLGGVAACEPATRSEDERLTVVATTSPVGAAAAAVGGDAISLTVLLEPGIEAHDFELTPERGAALEQADVILLSGAGLEDWLTDTLDTLGAANRTRDLSAGVELRALDASGAVDPHYWLAAPNAVRMVENARDALTEAVPAEADGFAERASSLIARLEAADAEVRSLIDEIPVERRKVVTDHDAFGYFVEEYGLEFVGSVFPSLDVSSEPSAQEIERLVADIRAEGVTAIFTESAVNPRLARAIAEETDARLVEEPIYTDSLGPPGSGADTLDGMVLHNARVVHAALIGD